MSEKDKFKLKSPQERKRIDPLLNNEYNMNFDNNDLNDQKEFSPDRFMSNKYKAEQIDKDRYKRKQTLFSKNYEEDNIANKTYHTNEENCPEDLSDKSFEQIFIEMSQYDIFSLARHCNHEVLEYLLLKGISPDSRDLDGNTILIIGAQNGNKRIVKLALRFGAQINMKNCSGNTALHYASEYNYSELANYLIKKGANPTIENIKALKAYEGIDKKTDKINSRTSNKFSSIFTSNNSQKKSNNNKMFKFNINKINLGNSNTKMSSIKRDEQKFKII